MKVHTCMCTQYTWPILTFEDSVCVRDGVSEYMAPTYVDATLGEA